MMIGFTSRKRRRIEMLTWLLLDRAISPVQKAELDRAIQSSRQTRKLFDQIVEMHENLVTYFNGIDTPEALAA